MSFVTSPEMGLQIPTVGNEPGPLYATDVNNSLTIIDSHNHSAGSGVLITPAGLNINSDLPFNENSATVLLTARFSSQNAIIPNNPPNIGCIYVTGNELYYNDFSGGHEVQITNNGSVNSGAGSITGLPSGTASVSFAGATYVFQSATNVAANIDVAAVILRNTTPSSFGLTLEPPSLGADYTITLPPPNSLGQVGLVTYDTSNNMTSVTYDTVAEGITSTGANAIVEQIGSVAADHVGATMSSVGANDIATTMTSTGADLIGSKMTSTGANAILNTYTRSVAVTAGGLRDIVFSPGTGAFTTSSTSFVSISGSGVTLTLSGKPVQLIVAPDQSTNLCSIEGTGVIQIINNTTGRFWQWEFVYGTQAILNLSVIDFAVSPGAYNWSLLARALTGTISISYVQLTAFELY